MFCPGCLVTLITTLTSEYFKVDKINVLFRIIKSWSKSDTREIGLYRKRRRSGIDSWDMTVATLCKERKR